MIVLSWARLNAVAESLTRLSVDKQAGSKAQYRAARIVAIGKQEIKKIQAMQMDTYRKYQKLDEKLNPVFDPQTGNPVFTEGVDGAKKCWEEVADKMENTLAEIHVQKFDWQDVKHLTGADLVAIEDLINGGVPEDYAG